CGPQLGRTDGREVGGMREKYAPRVSDKLKKINWSLAGIDGEIRNAIADTNVALICQLLLRSREGDFRAFVLELEYLARSLVGVRKQGLILVPKHGHRAFLDRAREHEAAVRLTQEGQVEAEGAVIQKLLLCSRALPMQDLVSMGKPTKPT